MPYKPGYKRTQYFVAKKFQLRYIGLILFLAFSTAIMCAYVIYYTMMITMGDKLANIYPQGRLVAIVNAVNIRILFSMLLIAPLIILIGVYASHKIAGPIGRIERFLKSVAEGDLSLPLTLRKNDELVSLAGGINGVVESIKANVKKEKAVISDISASMDGLKKLGALKPVDNAALNQVLAKLSEDVSVLKAEVEKYKI